MDGNSNKLNERVVVTLTKPKLFSYKQPKQLHIHAFERYLPTAFDESLSLLEKVNKVIHYLRDNSHITEEMIGKWNEVYHWVMNDGLDDAIGDRLLEYIDNGKFEEILANLLLHEYLKKDDFYDAMKDFEEEFDKKLKDTLDSVEEDIDELKKLINNEVTDMVNFVKDAIENLIFDNDFTRMQPLYITEFGGYRNAVNQGFAIDTKTQQILSSQADTGVEPEGFYINRHTPSGRLMDYMYIKGAGHGTVFGVDRKTNGNQMLWVWHTSTGKLIHIKYQAFKIVEISEVETMYDYNPDASRRYPQHISYDEYHDILSFVRTSTNEVIMRDRQDVMNGVNNILHTINIDPNESTSGGGRAMQGYTSFGTDVYWLSGFPGQPIKIQMYDAEKNELVKEKIVTNAVGQNGVNQAVDSFYEPEGMSYFVDNNGKETLLFVLTEGGGGKRRNNLYGYVEFGGEGHWNSVTKAGTQIYKTIRNDGKAMSTPDNLKSLDDLVQTGTYFMPMAQAEDLIKGLPLDPSGAHWYVEVYPLTYQAGGYQKLIRYSSKRQPLELQRYFSFRWVTGVYTFGEWTMVTKSHPHPEHVSAQVNRIADINFGEGWYMSNSKINGMVDAPPSNMTSGGGFWLDVRAGGTEGYSMQFLTRNSATRYQIIQRRINHETKQADSNWVVTIDSGSD